MPEVGEQPPTVRRARLDDVEAILDLLTHYDLPRSHFEALYYDDPTYKVDQSWVADRNGSLVAHLRVFYRQVRIDGHPLDIAGIGNVVTAREERGKGHAARLLDAALNALWREGVPYSLLWTHVAQVYERHGFAPIGEGLVRGSCEPLSSNTPPLVSVRSFDAGDLAAVMALYDATNAERTGPFVRSPDYWRAQMIWLAETPESFLVGRALGGELAGYIRTREGEDGLEFLELGIRPDDIAAGRGLLEHAAPEGTSIQGPLPPSLLKVFSEDKREPIDDPGLMGRVVNLEAFVRELSPPLSSRATGGAEIAVSLSTAGGSGTLRVSDRGAQLVSQSQKRHHPQLDEAHLAHLLFHGYEGGMEGLDNNEELGTLFPPQDFVIWHTDRF